MSLSTAIITGGARIFRKDRKIIKFIVMSVMTPTINLKIDKKRNRKLIKKIFFKMQKLLIKVSTIFKKWKCKI